MIQYPERIPSIMEMYIGSTFRENFKLENNALGRIRINMPNRTGIAIPINPTLLFNLEILKATIADNKRKMERFPSPAGSPQAPSLNMIENVTLIKVTIKRDSMIRDFNRTFFMVVIWVCN
jgi:hypothetical protein